MEKWQTLVPLIFTQINDTLNRKADTIGNFAFLDDGVKRAEIRVYRLGWIWLQCKIQNKFIFNFKQLEKGEQTEVDDILPDCWIRVSNSLPTMDNKKQRRSSDSSSSGLLNNRHI